MFFSILCIKAASDFMLDLMRKKIVFDFEFHDCCDRHLIVCVCVRVLSTEQRDDELSGPEETLQSQPDDHHLHHTALLPVFPRRFCVCHLHHVEARKHRTHPLITTPTENTSCLSVFSDDA